MIKIRITYFLCLETLLCSHDTYEFVIPSSIIDKKENKGHLMNKLIQRLQ